VAPHLHVLDDRLCGVRQAEYTQRTVAVLRAPEGKSGSHVLAYANTAGATEANALESAEVRLRHGGLWRRTGRSRRKFMKTNPIETNPAPELTQSELYDPIVAVKGTRPVNPIWRLGTGFEKILSARKCRHREEATEETPEPGTDRAVGAGV
jgi:hypothetical protein